MKHELICIACPQGCHLTVEKNSQGFEISGNKCPRGIPYATEEITAPKRVVTAVVNAKSSSVPYVPVRTDKPLPKEMIFKLLKELYSMQVAVPLKRGDCLIDNYNDTDVNVIFSRTVKE